MNNQPKIIIVDHEQHYVEPLTKFLADHHHLNLAIEFAEDKESLLAMVNIQTIAIVFKTATDYEYSFIFTFLNSQKLTTPVIYLTSDATPLTDDVQTKSLIKLYNAGIYQAVFYKNYPTLAAVIARIAELQAIKIKNEELKKQAEIAKNRAIELQGISNAAFCLINDGIVVQSNDHFSQPFGFHSAVDMIGSPIIDFISSKDHSKFKNLLKACNKSNSTNNTEPKVLQCQDIQNHTFPATLQIVPAEFEGEPCLQITISLETKAATPQIATNVYSQNEHQLYAYMQNSSLDHHYHLVVLLLNHFNVPKQIDLYDQYLDNITQKITQTFNDQVIFQIRQNIFCVFIADLTLVQIDQLLTTIKNHVNSNFPVFTRIDTAISEFAGQSDTLFLNDALLQLSNTALTSEVICAPDPEIADKAANALKIDMGRKKTLSLEIKETLEPTDKNAQNQQQPILSAINNNQFILEYQHIYDTIDDDHQFFELFLRLKLDNGEILQPHDFFELAASNNLATNIDKWVLTNACKELKKYQAHYPHTHILINMEAASLNGPAIEQILEKVSGLLGLDFMNTITLQFEAEALLLSQPEYLENLRAIQQFGCHISLKNFDNSEPHIQCAKANRIELVKFSKHTIGDLSEDSQSELIKQIVQSLQTLKIKSLISFIDTPATAARSWTLGARYIQGYFLHTPREQMEPHADVSY